MTVAILDGFNGGGQHREINLGPKLTDIEKLSQNPHMPPECYDTADIENDYTGGPVITMGYGFY